MKVAITGHTSGIGLSLYTRLVAAGYEVFGYSKSTGHDIESEEVCNDIVRDSLDCDVFINNAYHPIGQNALLEKILDAWCKTDKCIVNISSNIVSLPDSFFITPADKEYRNAKDTAKQIISNYTGSARVLNVLPDLVNTKFYLATNPEKGMSPEYVSDRIFEEIKHNLKMKELVINHPDWNVHV